MYVVLAWLSKLNAYSVSYIMHHECKFLALSLARAPGIDAQRCAIKEVGRKEVVRK